MSIILYDYWRSSAAYRVRIALNLKGITYQSVPIDLREGAQRGDAYAAVNPQQLVPTLEIDGHRLTQSLAIIDYLDMTRPGPRLIPADPAARADAIAKAQIVMADIHPIQNLRVMKYLASSFGADEEAQFAWNRHWIETGFGALEQLAPDSGLMCGDAPTIADIALIPQMANARRFGVDCDAFPRLQRIDRAACALPQFEQAAPEAVKPA